MIRNWSLAEGKMVGMYSIEKFTMCNMFMMFSLLVFMLKAQYIH